MHTLSIVRRAHVAVILAAVLTAATAVPAAAQTLPPYTQSADLSGPRFGLTLLSDGIVAKLAEKQLAVARTYVTQFGWQFERQFFAQDSGVTMVTEWVALIGGLEQSVA